MKTLMDPYDWLPGYGESLVFLRTEPHDRLIVTVGYDDPEARDRTRCRDVVFDKVTEFTKRSFPGLLFDDKETTRIQHERARQLGLQRDRTWAIDTLSVNNDSVRAEAWAFHFGYTRVVNAYTWLFMAENLELKIYASGFSLGEQRDCDLEAIRKARSNLRLRSS